MKYHLLQTPCWFAAGACVFKHGRRPIADFIKGIPPVRFENGLCVSPYLLPCADPESVRHCSRVRKDHGAQKVRCGATSQLKATASQAIHNRRGSDAAEYGFDPTWRRTIPCVATTNRILLRDSTCNEEQVLKRCSATKELEVLK
jgi:hypothetical protein